MWSGSPHWASWALQPQNIKNMNHDEVDWAELAKQWIQMKENVDTPPPPPPLPPPLPDDPQPSASLPLPSSTAKDVGESQAGGEMDMEIEDEKDIANGNHQHQSPPLPIAPIPPPPLSEQEPAVVNGDVWSGWWEGVAPQTGAANWSWGWPIDQTQTDSVHPPGTDQSIPQSQYSCKPINNYTWLPESLDPPQPPQQPEPPREIDYDHRHRSRGHYSGSHGSEKPHEFHLDAAQRKKLPVWIREGLEKMEREKQKKLDKEREIINKEELLRKKKEAELQARRILKEDLLTKSGPTLPSKSKFESDSESSIEGEPEGKIEPQALDKSSADRSVLAESPQIRRETTVVSTICEEERVEQMMLKLRRWMTEILLDVTSAMIEEVAHEVIQKSRHRASAVQVKKPSALSSLSGGLGLSIYSDSESEDERASASRDLGGGPVFEENVEDSDEELHATIERKKRLFEATERSILQKLQRQEEEVRMKIKDDAGEEEVTKELSETQPREEVSSVDSSKASSQPCSPEHTTNQLEDEDQSSNSKSPFSVKGEKKDSYDDKKVKRRRSHSDKIKKCKKRSRKRSSSSEEKSKRSHSVERSSRSVTLELTKRTSRSNERRSKMSRSVISVSRSISSDRSKSIERRSIKSVSVDSSSGRSVSVERKERWSRSKESRTKKSRSSERKVIRRSVSRERKRRRSRRSYSRERRKRKSREKANRRSKSRDRKRSRSRSVSRFRRRSRSRRRSRKRSRRSRSVERRRRRRERSDDSESGRRYRKRSSVIEGRRRRSTSGESGSSS